MLEGDGVETGVDLDALIAISEWLEGVLGRPLEGQLYRAGALSERVARREVPPEDLDLVLAALMPIFSATRIEADVVRIDERDQPVEPELCERPVPDRAIAASVA